MTVRASATPEATALEVTPPPGLPAPIVAAFGIVVEGTPNGDVIVMSHRALAILRAGQCLKAFVIAGLTALRRTVALGANRTLLLAHGVYQLV